MTSADKDGELARLKEVETLMSDARALMSVKDSEVARLKEAQAQVETRLAASSSTVMQQARETQALQAQIQQQESEIEGLRQEKEMAQVTAAASAECL